VEHISRPGRVAVGFRRQNQLRGSAVVFEDADIFIDDKHRHRHRIEQDPMQPLIQKLHR